MVLSLAALVVDLRIQVQDLSKAQYENNICERALFWQGDYPQLGRRCGGFFFGQIIRELNSVAETKVIPLTSHKLDF
jgi:hypothetical protein